MVLTWLSRPMMNNIKKKSTAHKEDMGNLERASGYATNVKPGPSMREKKN